MNTIKNCLIRVTVILFLLSNAACSPKQTNGVLIDIDEVGSGYAVIVWESVPDVTGYEVYAAHSQSKEYTLLNSTTELKYVDTSLMPLSVAYYKVKPYSETNGVKVYKNFSNTVSTKTGNLGIPELSTLGFISDDVYLAWTSIVGATGYQVYVSNVGDYEKRLVCTTEVPSCTIPIIESKTYYFSARAITQGATETFMGEFSQVLVIIAKPIMNPNITLTAYDKRIDIVWNAQTKVTGYEVFIGDSSVFLFAKMVKDIKTTRISLTGLTLGKKYFVWVRSYIKTSTGKIYSEFAPVYKFATTYIRE